MSLQFNDQSEKPQFMYKHNELVPHSYQIFEWKAEKQDYEPVGEYTVLDQEEDPALSEKKVMNVITLLNGRKDLMDLGHETKSKTLFNVVPKENPNDPVKIIFRNHDGKGTSTEKAMLVLEEGVLNDSQFNIQQS